MIRERDRPTIPLSTQPIARIPRIDPYVLITLGVAARFLICLAAIWAGILIAVNGPNDGTAILAAIGCGLVINACLGRIER